MLVEQADKVVSWLCEVFPAVDFFFEFLPVYAVKLFLQHASTPFYVHVCAGNPIVELKELALGLGPAVIQLCVYVVVDFEAVDD